MPNSFDALDFERGVMLFYNRLFPCSLLSVLLPELLWYCAVLVQVWECNVLAFQLLASLLLISSWWMLSVSLTPMREISPAGRTEWAGPDAWILRTVVPRKKKVFEACRYQDRITEATTYRKAHVHNALQLLTTITGCFGKTLASFLCIA